MAAFLLFLYRTGPFSRIFLNWVKNMTVVTVAATISLTGSARKTPKTLFWKNRGRMKIRGISRMILRRQAISRLIFACPRAMKLCWHASWKPMEKMPAI